MCKINCMLYKCISNKYSGIPEFAENADIPREELNVVLLKENLIFEIMWGLEIFSSLKLDVEKLLLNNEISESGANNSAQAAGEFRNRYIRLSEIEKKKITNFIRSVGTGTSPNRRI